MSALLALVTDFGGADSYVTEMIASACARVPSVRVVSACHDVAPFNVTDGALVAERVMSSLPRGAALVVVVDPGVGTARRRVFGKRNGVWMVGPDNGVLPFGDGHEGVWEIDPRRVRPREGVRTFDGREVFGPVGAWLAAGMHPDLLGTRVTDWMPSVADERATWSDEPVRPRAIGRVIAVDRYGNAITSVWARGGDPREMMVVRPAGFEGRVVASYAEIADREGRGIVGSSGRIELSKRERSSGCAVGTVVEVRWDGRA